MALIKNIRSGSLNEIDILGNLDVSGSGRFTDGLNLDVSGALTISTPTVNNIVFANVGTNNSPYMRWIYNPDNTNSAKTLLYQHKIGLLNGSIYIAPTSQVGNETYAPTGDGNYVFGGGGILTTGTSNTIIGRSAANNLTTGNSGIYIGNTAGVGVISSNNNIHISSVQADNGNVSDSIHLGAGAAQTRAFTVGAGGSAADYLTNMYIGGGYKTPNFLGGDGRGVTIQPTTEDGKLDAPSLNIVLAGARGTGTGSAGDVILSTAVTQSAANSGSLHTLTNRVWVKGHTGFVGIGTSSPSASLDVSGSVRITDVLTLPYQHPLPPSPATGSIALSGSGATFVGMFVWTGAWTQV